MTNAFDSANYPVTEPTTLGQGDRWTWKRTDLTAYPPASYALSYEAIELSAATPGKFTVTASGSGSDFVVEVSSTTTDDIAAATYAWTAYITRSSDSERIPIGTGTWRVVADFATDETDQRTFAQQQIDRLQTVIAGLSTRQHQSYSVGGRSVTLQDLTALRRELTHWKWKRQAELNAERVRAGHGSVNSIRSRFR